MADNDDALTPAYVSYTSFKNQTQCLALEGAMPKHVDHSVLPTVGGSTRKMYFAALRFFGLLADEKGTPTERLAKLASAEEPEWKDYMQTLLQERYGPLVEQLVDATPKSLRDAFVDHFSGLGQSVVEPAMRFFLAAVRDVGLPASPRLFKRKPRSSQPKNKRIAKKPTQGEVPREPRTERPTQLSLHQSLLDKFPNFDPQWEDEHKTAWFESFRKLMEITTTKPEEPAGESAGS